MHAADREWVTCPSPRIVFWEGEERQLWEGVKLLRLGGHFPGSSVLLWEAAQDGSGVVFAGASLPLLPSTLSPAAFSDHRQPLYLLCT